MSESAHDEGGKKRAALSRELSEFLIELSIAVHRFAMYPESHPSLAPAAENVIRGLAGLFQERETLSLGIGQRQLVVEGIATDERHPVLSDLAARLHAHQLGAISFSRGVTLEEIEALLGTLSVEPERGGRPIGLLPEDSRPSWEHVRLLPIGYDRLEMRDGSAASSDVPRSHQLWLSLASAALEGDAVDPSTIPEGRSLAKVIEARQGDADYEQVIVSYMLQIASELRGAGGQAAAEIQRKMAELIRDLDDETVRRMVELGGGAGERGRFLRDVSQGGLPVESVLKILRAAAHADGQSISTSLTRLLSKLAVHADQGAKTLRAEAESAMREHVEALISDWDLEDPNPDAYTEALDRMARAAPELGPGSDGARELAGAERVLQMAVEVDAYGPTVQKAVSGILDEGLVGRIFDIVDAAPAGNQVAERVRALVMTPEQLKRLLAREDVEEEGLRTLVDRLGRRAIDPLFQYLTESDSRSVRRKIFDVLTSMGGAIGEAAAARLHDERWYVKRNMLALLHKLEQFPAGFSPLPYIQHPDARVRREAFPLALRMSETRTRALASALADSDERIVRMALLEVQEELPETLVPVVVGRVLGPEGVPALRSLAVRALGNVRSPLALEALLEVCSGGRSLLGRPRLAQKSPELLPALSALARRWRDDDRAVGFLALAERSKDLQVQAAVRGAGVG